MEQERIDELKNLIKLKDEKLEELSKLQEELGIEEEGDSDD